MPIQKDFFTSFMYSQNDPIKYNVCVCVVAVR